MLAYTYAAIFVYTDLLNTTGVCRPYTGIK